MRRTFTHEDLNRLAGASFVALALIVAFVWAVLIEPNNDNKECTCVECECCGEE